MKYTLEYYPYSLNEWVPSVVGPYPTFESARDTAIACNERNGLNYRVLNEGAVLYEIQPYTYPKQQAVIPVPDIESIEAMIKTVEQLNARLEKAGVKVTAKAKIVTLREYVGRRFR